MGTMVGSVCVCECVYVWERERKRETRDEGKLITEQTVSREKGKQPFFQRW